MSEIRRALVVDDEAVMTDYVSDLLIRRGVEVVTADSGAEAERQLNGESGFDLLVTDLQLETEETGADLVAYCRKKHASMPVVVMTAYGTVESAVRAMKIGANDFLTKPFGATEINECLDNIAAGQTKQSEQPQKERRARNKASRPALEIVGGSSALGSVMQIVEHVAPTNATVLLTGESGTGKELIASAIHTLSRRSKAPFIKVNCAAITDTLLESTLFGHEKGAFTGAFKRTPGKFELADGGTLLLDEISEMKTELQSKLLRVLQEKEFELVGGTSTLKTDVRIIATSNRNMREEVRKGNFREDLYFRLNVVPVHMPPLRERPDDIALLVEHFLHRSAAGNGLDLPTLNDELIEQLCRQNWPGNIRQLQNAVERAVVMGHGRELTVRDFLIDMDLEGPSRETPVFNEDLTIKEMEKRMILAALERFDDNRTQAARHLGISVRTLRNKLNLYRLQRESVAV